MTNFDDQARAAGERVRRRAKTISSDVALNSGRDIEVSSSGTVSPVRGWTVAAATFVAVAGVVAVGIVATSGDDSRFRDVAPTESGPAQGLESTSTTTSTTTVATPSPVVSAVSTGPSTDPSAETTAPSTTTSVVDAETAFRPYVADPDVCVSSAARESNIGEYADGLLRPFALSSAGWYRFQIVADPELGVDGRWALVGTIPAADAFDANNWDVTESDYRRYDTINGWPVSILLSPSGYTDARIDLGGETDAYVRSYRFDLDSTRSLISRLTARATDERTGFDYSPVPELAGLEMVLDRGDEPVDANIAVVECVIENVTIFRIAAITGDPLVQYVTILDQPYPYDIGHIGDAAVSISGRQVEGGPRLSDVTLAPADTWNRLLEQRAPSEGPVQSDG